jgi:hypothetical protein
MKKPLIYLDEQEVIRILADLDFLVVSLDRLGSAQLSEGARKSRSL